MRRSSHPAFLLMILMQAPNFYAGAAESLIQVNRRSLISRAGLVFDKPATRSEEGLPIGNGRMGSLVWTTPSALKLQINRVDVHAMDSATVSFPRADTDYGSVCGYPFGSLIKGEVSAPQSSFLGLMRRCQPETEPAARNLFSVCSA